MILSVTFWGSLVFRLDLKELIQKEACLVHRSLCQIIGPSVQKKKKKPQKTSKQNKEQNNKKNTTLGLFICFVLKTGFEMDECEPVLTR